MTGLDWDRVQREKKYAAAQRAYERFLESLLPAAPDHSRAESAGARPQLHRLLRRRQLSRVALPDWAAFEMAVANSLATIAHDRYLVLSGPRRAQYAVAGKAELDYFLAVNHDSVEMGTAPLRDHHFHLDGRLPAGGFWWLRAFRRSEGSAVGEWCRRVATEMWGVEEAKRLRVAKDLLCA